MQNILMIGDSWGVPNYGGPPGVEPKYHTEFLLKDLGYNVYNCAINGAGNIMSLDKAKTFLEGNPIKVDWIVWFHTEFFRNSVLFKKKSFEENIEHFSNKQYQIMSEFIKDLGCKIAVIGGQCPIRDNLFAYMQPEFYIKDWKNLILEMELPEAYALAWCDRWLNHVNESPESKLEILNKVSYIYAVLSKSEDFPDGGHPGIRPHAWLSKTLDKVFKGEVAQTVRAMDS